MLTTYRAMREVLPHVAIASDCYHITALINHAIEVPLRREQRRELDHLGQQTLKGNRFLLLSNYKDLKPDRKAQLDALLEVKQPLLQSGPESGIWPESEKPWLRTGRVAQLSQGHPANEYLRCFSGKGSMTSQRHPVSQRHSRKKGGNPVTSLPGADLVVLSTRERPAPSILSLRLIAITCNCPALRQLTGYVFAG